MNMQAFSYSPSTYLMKQIRFLSFLLLLISGTLGLIRGYNLINNPSGNSILFPYSIYPIKDSVFTNYHTLGWIVFFLIGVFSLISLVFMLFKNRLFSYLMIAEGIFICFLALTHILFTSFAPIHVFVLIHCTSIIMLGLYQTPRDFSIK